MAQQGWYPDPSGRRDTFRWFDGSRWTEHTSTDPRRPAPQAAAGPRRAQPLLVTVLVGLVALALVAVALLVLRPWADASPGPAPSPTVSAWDERTSPSPSRPPTPSLTPADVEACEPATGGEPPPAADPERVRGGPLSFPAVPGWEGPTSSARFPHGRSARAMTLQLEEEMPWQASAEAGELVLGTIPGPAEAPGQLLQCVLTSSFYTSIDLEVSERDVREVEVDGRPAHRLDARISFQHPRLETTGSLLTIVVVDADVDGYFFGAVPQERTDLLDDVERAAAGLRVEG